MSYIYFAILAIHFQDSPTTVCITVCIPDFDVDKFYLLLSVRKQILVCYLSYLLMELGTVFFSFNNISDVVQCFTAVLQGIIIRDLVPERKFRAKQNTSPWAIGADISAARRRRDRLHCQALATGDPAIWWQFCDMRNRVKQVVEECKVCIPVWACYFKTGASF